ncbi:putative colanic acid biosynthesis acetyltransferase [Acidipila rosea]|uniref:Putative colanic acid biosynthesis acetyltransferase WcaF n=1 Tax=Acidipila rosea TaxID=768535 RepID=A0A4R1L7P7_9BACT|nr:putative colanic acid biosynthesis acetyltransferase [Acidipila rosea]TCK74246.1 putative colanic acid biosynthesis acetyltransferase WcaF [Acidipila rosea]
MASNPSQSEQPLPYDPDAIIKPSFSLGNRIRRALWGTVYVLLYRPSPRPAHAWRAMLLRLFGAKLGPRCRFYPKATIWAPWNLDCEDRVLVANGVELYNPSMLTMGSHAIVSQGAYLCGATHLYNDPAFPLVSFPMRLGAYSWICARAVMNPGVNAGAGSILGLGAIATRDLDPLGIYAGVPAKKIGQRDPAAVPAQYRPASN